MQVFAVDEPCRTQGDASAGGASGAAPSPASGEPVGVAGEVGVPVGVVGEGVVGLAVGVGVGEPVGPALPEPVGVGVSLPDVGAGPDDPAGGMVDDRGGVGVGVSRVVRDGEGERVGSTVAGLVGRPAGSSGLRDGSAAGLTSAQTTKLTTNTAARTRVDSRGPLPLSVTRHPSGHRC